MQQPYLLTSLTGTPETRIAKEVSKTEGDPKAKGPTKANDPAHPSPETKTNVDIVEETNTKKTNNAQQEGKSA